MKHRATLMFMLFIGGCSSGSDLVGNRVRIEFRDGGTAEYSLLAIEDSSLIVTPAAAHSLPKPQTLPFSQIERVYHGNTNRTVGALIGGTLAAIIGVQSLGDAGGHSDWTPILVVVPVTLAGIALGWFIPSNETGYDPSNTSDRNTLKKYAMFPEAVPPELRGLDN